MELSEFKDLWQSRAESKTLADKYNPEKINELVMNANATLNRLHGTNLFWWNFTKISTILLFAMLALTLSLFLIDPESHPQLKIALPFVFIIAFCSLVSLWLYYEQAKIFDIKDAGNMKLAIESSLQRFSRFYFLFNSINLIMFPVVFYIARLLIDMGFFRIELIFDKSIAFQSVLLALIAMAVSHWYYKKKYFTRLAALKNDLKELNEETPDR